jgi:hypothetical protein
MQLLFSWQPEESPEELILCSGFKVPGEGWGRELKKAGKMRGPARSPRKLLLNPPHNPRTK